MPDTPDTKPTQAPPTGKIGRLSSEARGLVDDTRQWVDAKLRLFELDLEEKLDGIANKVIAGAAVVFLAALALIFALTALALLLGSIWENEALGFMVVALGAFVIALLIQWLRPRFVKGSMGVAEKTDALPEAEPPRQLEAPKNGQTK
ncbi:MAG: hypothetical protein HKN29_15480 [Rhodothermales bacterium]|nr:hypothetical protein [Rhodothermales bacterium]